jgi:hypothetical protein
MIPRYTENDFNVAKSADKLNCECEYCHNIFGGRKRDIQRVLTGNPKHQHFAKYCSRECFGLAKRKRIEIPCYQCGKIIIKRPSEIKDSKHTYCSVKCQQTPRPVALKCSYCGKEITIAPNRTSKAKLHFCSNACTGKYYSEHKTWGNKRSKLEMWLEPELRALYPALDIHFNRNDTINSELDIYIPSLKLAFELNGAFHYEPIYSQEQLQKIQNNDARKFQACLEQEIELCVINNTSIRYFTPRQGYEFLNIITDIINKKTTALPTSSR